MKSNRGRYWHCNECREFVPDELTVCPDCGRERYARTGKYAGIHVSVLPPGLRGDKMYVYRQNGKQVMDKMQAKQEQEIRNRTRERMRSSRPVVIQSG